MKIVFVFICLAFLYGCEEEKPSSVEGDYSGTITLDNNTSSLFITLRLGEVEKDKKYESPNGQVLNKTDVWKIEGALSGPELNNVRINGSYVSESDIPIVIESIQRDNKVLILHASFDTPSKEMFSGIAILRLLENGNTKEEIMGSFEVSE